MQRNEILSNLPAAFFAAHPGFANSNFAVCALMAQSLMAGDFSVRELEAAFFNFRYGQG